MQRYSLLLYCGLSISLRIGSGHLARKGVTLCSHNYIMWFLFISLRIRSGHLLRKGVTLCSHNYFMRFLFISLIILSGNLLRKGVTVLTSVILRPLQLSENRVSQSAAQVYDNVLTYVIIFRPLRLSEDRARPSGAQRYDTVLIYISILRMLPFHIFLRIGSGRLVRKGMTLYTYYGM